MDNEARAKIYWEKSAENLAVSRESFKNNQFNASASRYYYALYQAFFALFEYRGIEVKNRIHRKDGWVDNPHPGVWTKPELHDHAKKAINDYEFNVGTILNSAHKKRVTGDYKDVDVQSKELAEIQSRADGIFKVIEREINKK